MIQIAPFVDLVFVYMPGCDACEEAMPEIDKLGSQVPSLMVLKIQADGPLVSRLLGRVKIKATPTYVLRVGGQGYVHEGAMTAKQVKEWMQKITEGEDDDDQE